MGGTKIAAGVVSPAGELLREVRYETPHEPEALLERLARAVNEAKDGYEVAGVCLAVPGFILAEECKVVFSPNLHAVEGIPLKDELEPELGCHLTVENDANAAAWGEFRFGAGSGVDHLVFVTLGTGIGGGVISHGVLLRGACGAGGELGHVTIQATGLDGGEHTTLEHLASGTAIRRRARRLAAEKPASMLGEISAEREPLGEDVTRLAREGDEDACSILEETGRWLGVGLAGFVNVFNPEMIAVGGGVAGAGDLILAPARKEMYRRAFSPSRDLVEIRAATLGAESGILGAAALARHPGSGEYVLGP